MAQLGCEPTAVGVLMAGGEGRRMLAGGESIPKPLVPILGAPLVERNLWALMRAGLTDIRVVVGAGQAGAAVTRWASTRAARLAAAVGATVQTFVESHPLGNCGGLALAVDADDPRTVVLAFADNLTDLDPNRLLMTMKESAAEIVVAVHDEPFRLPYGVLDMAGCLVTGYREKPTIPIRVGSGLAAIGARSRSLVEGPMGLVDLVNRTVAAGRLVVARPHAAHWIDVNDRERVAAAEAMVRSHPDTFERWCPNATLLDPFSSPDCAQSLRGVLLDDLDASGAAVRVWSGTASPAVLSQEGWARVSAWRRVGPGDEIKSERTNALAGVPTHD